MTVYYSVGGTASSGDYSETLSGSVVIADGQSSATIDVTPVDDSEVEGDETVQLTLSTDAAYTIGTPSQDAVTIADDEAPTPTVTLTANDAAAAEEGPDAGQFTVSRDTTDGALTVYYSVGGTASSGDYSETLSGSVVIADGQSSATIDVTPVDDSEVEGDETVQLTLSTDAAYTIGTPSQDAVTIADNDVSQSPEALRVSSNGRYIETVTGDPVFLTVDTAWLMPQKVNSQSDLEYYLTQRRQRGFNCIHAMFMFQEKEDWLGNDAFTSESPLQPNETFWSRMDWIVDTVEAEGMYMMVFPAWARAIGDFATNDTKMRDYGEFLGDRYGDEPHLLWAAGGDTAFDISAYRAFAEGFMKGRTGQTVAWNQNSSLWDEVLFTAHPAAGDTARDYLTSSDYWLTFDSAYTYRDANRYYPLPADAYEASPTEPVHFIEGHYELEHTNRNKMIQERWQPVTAGSFSNALGNEDIWMWGDSRALTPANDCWKDQLDSDGTRIMDHFGKFWRARQWWTFAPRRNDVVLDTLGDGSGIQNERITAIHSSAMNQTVVFFPHTGSDSAEIDLDHLGDAQDTLTVRWYDPWTNEYGPATTLSAGGDHEFTRPAAGVSAVLVLQGEDAAPPAVTLTANDDDAAEAGTDAGQFTVSRDGTSGALTVRYTVGGTADSNDYSQTLSGSVVIPDGQSSATIDVTPVNDANAEGNETVELILSDDPAYVIASPAGDAVTIADDEVTDAWVTLAATEPIADESGPTAGQFTVTRDRTDGALTVYYSSDGGTASSSDYSSLSGSVVIPDGQPTATIDITPVNDSTVEGSETVRLTLTPDAAYTIGAASQDAVTIADNDTVTGAFIESGGQVVLEAENYTDSAAGAGALANHTWESAGLSGASGGQAMRTEPNSGASAGDTTNGPRLDYDVNFTTTGVYYIWVRMLGTTGNKSVHAGLDGELASGGSTGLRDQSGSWHWEQTVGSWRVTVLVDTPGYHTVNLWMREDYTPVDKIVLTTDARFTPTTTGPDQSSREGHVAVEGFESGDSAGGQGWADDWTLSGQASIVSTGSPYGGSYHLKLAGSDGAATRTVNLAGKSEAELTFWWKASSFETGESATVEIYDGSWHTVLTIDDTDDDNTYHEAVIDLSGYNLIEDFQIRISSDMGDADDLLYIDDLTIA